LSRATSTMSDKETRIKTPILFPVALAILILLTASIASIYGLQRRNIRDEVQLRLEGVWQLERAQVEKDAQLLLSLLNFTAKDDELQAAWLAKDEESLLERGTVLFEDIKAKFPATYFKFIGLDKTCFVCIHNKKLSCGEHIQQFTLDKAIEDKKPAYGIELSKCGALLVRVIYPWEIDGEIVGYIELAEDIETMTWELRETLGVDLIYTINKVYLDRNLWEQGLLKRGRGGAWEKYENFVVSNRTIRTVPPVLDEYLKELISCHSTEHLTSMLRISLGRRSYEAGFVPLVDAGGRDIGDIIVLTDITRQLAAIRGLSIALMAGCVLMGVALFVFFYIFLCRIEKRLTDAHNNLMREIKEREEAEEALVYSEAIYRRTIENAHGVPYEIRFSEEKYRFVGSGIMGLMGISREELTLPSYKRLIEEVISPPEGRSISFDEYKEAFRRGEIEQWCLDLRIRTPQGQTKWLSDCALPVVDKASNEVTGAIGILQDITERKQTEEALRKSEEQLRTILDSWPDIILQVDKDMKVMWANQTALDLNPEALGQYCYKAYTSNGGPCKNCPCKKALATGELEKATTHQKYMEGIEGESYWEDIGIPLKNRWGNVTSAITISRNVTERKQIEETRKKLMEVLEAKNWELESIIHVTSHDLRTPLVTISGFSNELSASCEQLKDILKKNEISEELRKELIAVINEDIPEAADLVAASASKIGLLLDGLVRLAKLGFSATEIVTLDMNKEMEEIVKTLSFHLKQTGAKLDIGDLPRCFGDKSQIAQVLYNLLSNALKYLDSNRQGMIRISGQENDNNSVYCIEDNGVGIESDNLTNIFKMFYRVHPSANDGEGMGLAIVRRIVNRHQGKVWVESTPGEGSRFYVSLPNKRYSEIESG
jgi:PAS domain S-box-containing protein